MDERSSFIIRTKYENVLASLPHDQQGEILMALIAFVVRDEVSDLPDPSAQMLLNVMIEDVQEDKEKYKERCEKNRRNAYKKWGKDANDANAYDRMQSHANDANGCERCRYDSDSDYDCDSEYDNDSYIRPVTSYPSMDDRKNALKNQISDLTKITLSKVGGA